ncbi:hypothetical protein [Novosphingobium beihaiensis]|uniref:Uncharacterized protein n=1 Tax=Novosphingobium beihaiensis TaxID=2930389 RepID=A0ABT0BUR2_9SPHN|nr:hypothetical protein [Novosphingobium beihaiensis]MCJ2188815.1 hypothetical protein [Novosphingobium beihaiensis]
MLDERPEKALPPVPSTRTGPSWIAPSPDACGARSMRTALAPRKRKVRPVPASNRLSASPGAIAPLTAALRREAVRVLSEEI